MRRTRPLVAGIVLAALAASLAACGIPVDSQPHDITDRRSPTSVASAVSSTVAQNVRAKVFFIATATAGRPDRLQTTLRPAEVSLPSVIKELLKGPTADEAKAVLTAIPMETQLTSATLSADGVAEINLNDTFFNAKGDQLVRAVAQLVYTASAVPSVTQVRILVNGTPRDWPRADGSRVSKALTVADFAELSPSSQPDYVAIPSK
jgi:spore germination protein GerM